MKHQQNDLTNVLRRPVEIVVNSGSSAASYAKVRYQGHSGHEFPPETPILKARSRPRLCENAKFPKSVVIAINILAGSKLKWDQKS